MIYNSSVLLSDYSPDGLILLQRYENFYKSFTDFSVIVGNVGKTQVSEYVFMLDFGTVVLQLQ